MDIKLRGLKGMARVYNKLIAIVLIIGGYFMSPCLFAESSEILVISGQPFGFFFNFYCILSGLDYVERGIYRGISPEFGAPHLYYDPAMGPNWWFYYFEKTDVFNQSGDRIATTEYGALSNGARWGMSKLYAHELITKYIKIKPEIQREIDQFCDTHFQGHMIGIHYRGTDKWREVTSIVQYDEMLEYMEKQRSKYRDCRFFIATDEQGFLKAAIDRYKGQVVFRRQIRSNNNIPIHEDTKVNNYVKGREALIDCILLSRCNTLIRTSSNLSDASLCFNPYIELINDLDRDVMLPYKRN